jgi:diketogulonate reductase-like aldo/keto reductase
MDSHTISTLHDEKLQKIGDKHGVSAAEIAIASLLDQPDVIAIRKAQMESSQRSNLDVLKAKLDDEDRAAIAALPKEPALRKAAVRAGLDSLRHHQTHTPVAPTRSHGPRTATLGQRR